MKELGVGLYSVTGVYGKKDVKEMTNMLHFAVENGIKHFDVADSYGPAEEMLGKVLKEKRSHIKVATKVGIREDGTPDCSYNYVKEACAQSLQRLQTDYIDLYQIHFDDGKTPVSETTLALEELKKEGLICEYGLSHISYKRAVEYAEKSNPVTIMMEVSLVALDAYQEYLPLCREHGISILTMGSTGRGLLTGKIGPEHQFAPEDIRNLDALFQRSQFVSALDMAERVKKIAGEYGCTPVQVALAWVLAQEQISTVIVGPSCVEHLQENLGACQLQLTDEHIANLRKAAVAQQLRRKEMWDKEIREILATFPIGDKQKIFKDFMYIIEGLAVLKKADSEELFPMYRQFKVWLAQSGPGEELINIKETLKDIYYRN